MTYSPIWFIMVPPLADVFATRSRHQLFLFIFLVLLIVTNAQCSRITYNEDILLDIGQIHHRLSPVLLDCSFLLHVDTNWSQTDTSRQAATPPGSSRRNDPRSTHPRRRRGKRDRLHARLKARATKPPLPSLLLANVRTLKNKMDELRTRITYQREIRVLCSDFYRNLDYYKPTRLDHSTTEPLRAPQRPHICFW